MVLSAANPALRVALPMVIKRNFGSSYVLMTKSSDPIQQLFISKIREFGGKLNDKNFAKEYPDLQKALDAELLRVTKQYGGNTPEDLAQFPSAKLKDVEIDTHQGFNVQ